MTTYHAPVQDLQFVLQDVLKISQNDQPVFAEMDAETTQAILQEAGALAEEVLAPLNAVGDREGCSLEGGRVRTPTGFDDAYRKMCEGGWIGLDSDPAFGGQGMPKMLGTAVGEMFVSANMAFNMYQGLSHGAYAAIHAHGSDAQKQVYLPHLVSGEWSGTMNLTEPQCGTDLGLIRTRADEVGDGSYRITGQKIWISAGEHDLSKNIVHLVLARIPGGPEGIKGISLFIVPKFLVNDDGSLGARNGVSCGGLEEKMGIHGNATCVMNYDDATGYLIGEKHKGMRAMFTMMNNARLGVGLQGYAQGAVAYQNALAFAKDRQQGRAVGGAQAPDQPADPIIVHPDVRRNLLDQKSFTEGARALALWGAELIDKAEAGDEAADALVSLLTPVIKGFLTDKGFETTVLAQQTLGGSGFTREWGLEQFVRDSRITMIYEGTNGVQSLDLVGRKLGLNGGKVIMGFFEMLKAFIAEHSGKDEAFDAQYLTPLKNASKSLQEAAMFFMQHGMRDPNVALSGSYDFMHLFGHVCLGFMWSRMGVVAREQLAAGTGDVAFLEAKLATGRYYMARQLPAVATHLARVQSGADVVMLLEADRF